MSGTNCPTCGKAGLPRDMLREGLGIDTDGAMEALLDKDGGKHLRGMASHHPAVLVRVLAKRLLAKMENEERKS